MTVPVMVRYLVIGFLLAAGLPSPARAQDTGLAKAKEFYASASYDEALQVLNQLKGTTPGSPATEVQAYQIFCLVALGRNQEATDAIGTIVRTDPLYHPAEGEVSPRIRAFYENVRRPLLPAVVRQLYAKAKDKMDRKEMAQAASDFDRVIALLDEMGSGDDQGVSDLRTLASGFRDLSKAAAAAPPVAPPPPPPAPVEAPKPAIASPPPARVATAAPAEPRVYTPRDTGVVKPVAINRTLPPWRASTAVDKLQGFSGSVEVLVDEKGKVIVANIVDSVRADYDPVLLRAASGWTFQPATKDGVPVRYRYAIEVQLKAGSAR
jgi:protein TonB